MSLRSVIKRHIIDSLRHVLLIKTFSIDNIHPAYVLLDICFQHVRTYVVRIVRWPCRSKNSSSSLDVFYSRHWPSLTSFNWQYLFVYIWNLFITNQMYITCSYIGPFAAFPPADRNNTELSATTQNRTVSTGYQSLNNMKWIHMQVTEKPVVDIINIIFLLCRFARSVSQKNIWMS